MLSRISGFVRDILFAHYFGAGAQADAFFVAFKIPNFFRRLFAEGSFSLAFVPVFSEYKETRKREDLIDLAAHVSGTLGGLLLVLTTLAVIFAPFVTSIFAAGFYDKPEQMQLASEMLRITFPYLFFISLTAYAGGILNSYGYFAVPAFTPVLLNLCLISAALLSTRGFTNPEIVTLAWGVLAAGIVQLLFQLPFLRKYQLLPMPKWNWQHSGVRKIIKLMIPSIIGSSVAQINLLFDTLIASFLAAGSISWLYFSDRLVELPLGVFGVALSTVILPNLSAKHANKSLEEFSHILDWALRTAMLVAIPACIGLIVLATPIIATLFQHNAYSSHDTYMASFSLQAYALGLPAFILIKVLAPGFYAQQDTKTPVKIGIIALLSNMVLNVLFVWPMLHYDYIAPHSGLAFATTSSAWMQAAMLYITLRRSTIYRPNKTRWLKFIAQLLFACLMMFLALHYFEIYPQSWNNSDTLTRIAWLSGLIAIAIASFIVAIKIAGFQFRSIRHYEQA